MRQGFLPRVRSYVATWVARSITEVDETVRVLVQGTFSSGTPASDVTVGLPEFDARQDVTLERSLVLPFTNDPRLASALLDH